VTRDELERYLNVGRGRSVCVDMSLAPEYPGYVRSVTLRAGNVVTVEIHAHGTDEGGPIFNASYRTLDEAIAAVEAYLGKKLAEWVNASAQAYPELPTGAAVEEGHERLRQAIATKKVLLPSGEFQIQEDGYWSRAAEL
jgi:hypothetical protein